MKTHKHAAARAALILVIALAGVLAGPRRARTAATLVDIANDATDPSNSADTEPSIAVNPANPLEIEVVAFSGNWGQAPTGQPISAPVWRSNAGESIGRANRQLDPIFFKETAAQPGKAAGYAYAAKIVCGVQRDPRDMRLARGFYATTINVHNPGDDAAKFLKKLALSFPPEEQKPGKVLRISVDTLKPDEALKVDCNDVQRRLFPNGFPTHYIEGFIVIESDASLDVTAVYSTAALDREGNVTTHSSIDVEQINERRKATVNQGPPDLIPVPVAGGFCRLTPDGKLIVTVKNQGTGAAGASTTRVDFSSGGPLTLPTPALAPGASVDLLFNVPPGCFGPDCGFRIRVDSLLQVVESDEGNNFASGSCLG